MKFLKSLLLCFLFFGLGNFNAQDNDYKSQFVMKFLVTMEANHILERKNIIINKNLTQKLILLKKEYITVINANIDKNNTPIYAYLNYYPDINAVFLNRGNLLSDEKISDEEKQKYNELFMEIAKQIPTETYIELSKLTDEIKKDKFALTIPYRFEIFQDLFDENQRKRIDIINFLLWTL